MVSLWGISLGNFLVPRRASLAAKLTALQYLKERTARSENLSDTNSATSVTQIVFAPTGRSVTRFAYLSCARRLLTCPVPSTTQP